MKKLVLLAPVAALALAGCAHDPTMAATVAGQGVPVSDVSIMAKFLCASAASQSQGQSVPLAQVNQIAVTYLAGSKALGDVAKRHHITIPTVPAPPSLPQLSAMPSSQRKRATQLINEVDASLNFVQTRLGASDGQQMLSALVSLIQGEAMDGRFISNPEYPTLAGSGSGSLSTAVSAAAKSASSGQPSTSYLAALPAGQKCG